MGHQRKESGQKAGRIRKVSEEWGLPHLESRVRSRRKEKKPEPGERGMVFFSLQVSFTELSRYLHKKLGKQSKQTKSKHNARQTNTITTGGGWGGLCSCYTALFLWEISALDSTGELLISHILLCFYFLAWNHHAAYHGVKKQKANNNNGRNPSQSSTSHELFKSGVFLPSTQLPICLIHLGTVIFLKKPHVITGMETKQGYPVSLKRVRISLCISAHCPRVKSQKTRPSQGFLLPRRLSKAHQQIK